MQVLVLGPPLLVAAVAALHGFRRAFLFALLPCLLLLPAYYTWKLPGIPELSFHNYALLAAVAALLVGRDRGLLRFGAFDLWIGLLVATALHSEWVHRDLHEARNLAASMLMLVVAPYLLGKALGAEDGLVVALVGVLVVLGALVGWLSPYEARMGSNPFDLWRRIWPASVPWDGALYRAGIRRVAGPFAHPICQGFYFSLVIPLAVWLADRRLPARRAVRVLLLLGLVLGLLTSVSRGPMLGTVLALALARFGWSPLRLPLTLLGLPLAALAALVLATEFSAYVGVQRGEAASEAQETAAYRAEMLERYREVVMESPWTGYGRYQFPVVGGLKSIDNQYLFLALTHGLPHSVLFLALQLAAAGLLLLRLIALGPGHPRGRLGWSLLGTLVGAVLTQTTVFAGTQTSQLLLLLVGLSVALAGRLR